MSGVGSSFGISGERKLSGIEIMLGDQEKFQIESSTG
jgi:hypothetical protein